MATKGASKLSPIEQEDRLSEIMFHFLAKVTDEAQNKGSSKEAADELREFLNQYQVTYLYLSGMFRKTHYSLEKLLAFARLIKSGTPVKKVDLSDNLLDFHAVKVFIDTVRGQVLDVILRGNNLSQQEIDEFKTKLNVAMSDEDFVKYVEEDKVGTLAAKPAVLPSGGPAASAASSCGSDLLVGFEPRARARR